MRPLTGPYTTLMNSWQLPSRLAACHLWQGSNSKLQAYHRCAQPCSASCCSVTIYGDRSPHRQLGLLFHKALQYTICRSCRSKPIPNCWRSKQSRLSSAYGSR